jgi:hypothetical protein
MRRAIVDKAEIAALNKQLALGLQRYLQQFRLSIRSTTTKGWVTQSQP